MISERQMSKYQTETDSPVIGFNIKVRLWKYNGAQSLLPCTLCSDLHWSKMTGMDVISYFSKFDGILYIPSSVVRDDTGHKAVKTRNQNKGTSSECPRRSL